MTPRKSCPYDFRRIQQNPEEAMKRYAHITSIIVVVSVLCSTSAFAWNTRGHMMVAAVAYKELNQQTKNRVDALLRLNPDRDNWLDLIPKGTSAADRKIML